MATEAERQALLARGITPERARQLFQFAKPVNEIANYYLCGLYGDGKVGKTVLTARLAQKLGTKLFMISSGDNGSSSIEDWPQLIPYVQVARYSDPKWLQEIATAIRYDSEEFEEYGIISIDTISGVADQYIDYIERAYNATGKQGGRDALTPKQGVKAPRLEMASNEDYKALRQYMRPIIMDLAASKKTVFLITHEREPYHLEVAQAKRTGEEEPKMRPDLPDKVYKALHYNCSILCRMTRNSTDRFISTRGSEKISVGSRIRELDNKRMTDNEFLEITARWIRERSQRD